MKKNRHHPFWPKRHHRSRCRTCGSLDIDSRHLAVDRIDVTGFGDTEPRYVDGVPYVDRHLSKKKRKADKKAEARRRRWIEMDWL